MVGFGNDYICVSVFFLGEGIVRVLTATRQHYISTINMEEKKTGIES